MWEYWGLVLANPTNRVRVHVDFFTYHVLDGFLLVGNYGMKPACKSATMEMLKKVDKNHLLDDDERCTVCLEELGREGRMRRFYACRACIGFMANASSSG
nr:hypothetical protein Iba_chr04eCG7240 [Ipomoea batatas]